MQTSSASAKPSEAILVRGRNSILADNSPLIIIDGIPGDIYDVHPNDVESIEVLKDAPASAIYGSRGANGVILISTKEGIGDELQVSYNGSYSLDNYSSLPDFMNGEEFYNYKMERAPDEITPSEQQIYEEESWTDWPYSRKHEGAPPSNLTTRNFRDHIVIRSAETYLLKAEAEYKLGQPQEAANTINHLRRRANASEVSAGDIDIDFILDERARELLDEENRRYHLLRTEKWLERTREYNHRGGQFIQERDRLLPIPQEVIDANLTHDMQQNPGY